MDLLKILVFSSLVTSLSVFAVSSEVPIIGEPTKDQLIFNNELDNMLAPFTYRSSVILLTGMTAAYFAYEDDFEERKNRKSYRRGREKTWSKWGDIAGWGVLPISYAALAGINYLNSESQNKEHLKNIEYIGKSVIYTSLMTFALKLTIDQRRPKDRLKRDSFPSGHASSAFSFSTAVWLIHGPYWGAFTTALASWIAFSRIDDGSHYYHDSIFGAALGISYALGIYYNHYERKLPFQFSFAPTANLDGLQGRLSYSF